MKEILRWVVLAVVLPFLADYFYVDPVFRLVRALAQSTAELGAPAPQG